ncbi:MAG: GntR family transcriptional regulator [Lentisphaerae bacterium]|nr:GntR family transcriptional regulator [Lentisphaerota bacterium]
MKKSTTVYAPLVARIKREVLFGQCKPGEMLGTEVGLAAEAGISRGSVRVALNGLIEEGLVERRAGKGIFARELATGTRIAELVVPELGSCLWSEVAHGAQDTGVLHGVKLHVYNANRDLEADLRAIQQLPASSADGAIIAALHQRRMNSALVELWQTGYPFVLCDQQLQDIDVPSVLFDNHQIGYLATQQLIQLGHRRIGFVGYDVQGDTGSRLTGYRDALNDSGILFDRSLTAVQSLDHSAPLRVPSFKTFIESLSARSDRPTALVFHTADLAHFACPLLKQQGLRIPDDISVVAINSECDPVYGDPALSSVTLPAHEMGMAAMEVLLARVQNPTGPADHRVLAGRWEARSSTAAPSSGGV